jgi:hypothetical protein
MFTAKNISFLFRYKNEFSINFIFSSMASFKINEKRETVEFNGVKYVNQYYGKVLEHGLSVTSPTAILLFSMLTQFGARVEEPQDGTIYIGKPEAWSIYIICEDDHLNVESYLIGVSVQFNDEYQYMLNGILMALNTSYLMHTQKIAKFTATAGSKYTLLQRQNYNCMYSELTTYKVVKDTEVSINPKDLGLINGSARGFDNDALNEQYYTITGFGFKIDAVFGTGGTITFCTEPHLDKDETHYDHAQRVWSNFQKLFAKTFDL